VVVDEKRRKEVVKREAITPFAMKLRSTLL
jgi:hypothetical protein